MRSAIIYAWNCRSPNSTLPNTDSPRIPHDKVVKMTDFCHKSLSEGQCRG
jgi:hypothetical protein